MVREHELQDAQVGSMVRVGSAEGVILRLSEQDAWVATLEDVRRFEHDLQGFAEHVPLDGRGDAICGLSGQSLLQAIETHARQYEPTRDGSGTRRLHVMFIEPGAANWKKSWVWGIDQGMRFFSVVYDVDARTVGELRTSGCG